MRRLYTLLLWIALPVILTRLLIRGLRNHSYWKRVRERFGWVPRPDVPCTVWVHAVSVGEVTASSPLVEVLLERYPNLKVIVTTMTPTGADRVAQLFGERVLHRYVPYDYPFAINQFLNRIQPALAVILETEIWPNLVHFCHARGCKVIFTNVRLSERSYQRYQHVRRLIAPVLANATAIGVQSEVERERLIGLGARQASIEITGNMKFEVSLPASLPIIAEAVRREWGQHRPVFVAGSTHEGEEQIMLSVYESLSGLYPDLLLVIAPRHPERFDSVGRLVRRRGFDLVRRSDGKPTLSATTQVYIADTMGELPVFYSAADIAFIGGSMLDGLGGHNVLECCAVGVPVLYGPHMTNFEDIARITSERGAGVQVSDATSLIDTLKTLLSDADQRAQMGERGLRMIKENSGATERAMNLLDDHVANAVSQVTD